MKQKKNEAKQAVAKKTALVMWGGWDGHTPKESVGIFIPWLMSKGFEVEVSNKLDSYLDAQKMASYKLIVQSVTMSKITSEQSAGLQKAVADGTGLVGWHGGIIDSFREDTGYQFMTGAQWVSHPGGCIPSQMIDIVDKKHPLTQGIEDFEIKDSEQYYIHYDPGCHILCTTTFSGKYGNPAEYPAGTVMPYAYTRQWGKGKVFVACWGHTFKDFVVPQAKEIVQRAMLWAAGEKIEV